MPAYTVVNPGNLVDGAPMHISDVLANFNAIAAVVNNLDNSNLAGGIDLAKVTTVVYNATVAATVWTITHNLGKFPSVDVVDSGGNEIWPDIDYVDANTITVSFASPTSGKAYLN